MTVGPLDELAAALAPVVARAMPALAAAVPAEPAAVLGRLGVLESDVPDTQRGIPFPSSARESVLAALRWMLDSRSHRHEQLKVEQLIGPLQKPLTEAMPPPPAALEANPLLAPTVRTAERWVLVTQSGSNFTGLVSSLDSLRPGVTDLVLALVSELTGHPSIVPLLPSHAPTEPELAAAYLALALATASSVLRTLRDALVTVDPALILGVGLGSVIRVLRGTPMPEGYRAAVLASARLDFRLPRANSGSITVSGHRFALAEGKLPDAAPDFADNGLVAEVDGGLMIRTGVAEGQVHVGLQVLEEAPAEVNTVVWDDVIEVSWAASEGLATVYGAAGSIWQHPYGAETPPWPGNYRVRVHADGRDENSGERYQVVVWSAPPAPQLVHKRTDHLGHRLRGEPGPPVVERPEQKYYWFEKQCSEPATILVATGGVTVDQVLRIFGADPSRPTTMSELYADPDFDYSRVVRAWPVDDGVLAWEVNGWQGASDEVLRPLSLLGPVASWFWNVNALTSLCFALGGQVLAAFEPGFDQPPDEPEITALLADLDFDDYRHKNAKTMLAIERFTGHELPSAHFEGLSPDGPVYRIEQI